MPAVIINDQRMDVGPGTTILAACRTLGIPLPTLCHDDRVAAIGACRLCVVEVAGRPHPVAACTTVLEEGMRIMTHPPRIEALRRTLLELLAGPYPGGAAERSPEKEFHRWLLHYHVEADNRAPRELPFVDPSHPYLHADLSRCILCHRCVRLCDDVEGRHVWRVWGRGDRTRIAPDSPTLAAGGCVSCGACADTCPTGAIEDRPVLRRGPPATWTRTTCPYCGTGCELRVGVREEQVIQIRPVPGAPVSRGHLCVKGRYAFEYAQAPDRIREPMIRRRGRWEPVDWAGGIAFVADRLRSLITLHGPDSMGMLASARATNEENYLTQKFARIVLGTNNVDGCARVCHQPSAGGMSRMLGTGAATNSFDDIEVARSFLVVGCNPTENHPVVGARIRQAVRRGAGLVVLDPRRTELAELADVHLALRPGTNIPLLQALANVVLAEGLEASRFVQDRVEGIDAFRAFVAPWTPERASEICEVGADEIRQAARLYAGDRPSMCFHGLGVTEHWQGTETVMALLNLALLTGNLGGPGCGINPLRGQNNVQGSAHMGCEPGHLTGYATLEAGRSLFESIWRQSLPTRPGLNLLEMMDAAGAGRLKGLWVIGYDVAHTNPQTAATREALRSLECVVVQDLFLTETAREWGTVFLPACSSLEKDGTFMNGERRVQRVRRVLSPQGHARPDWEILCAVAKAMGHGEAFEFDSAEAVWNEIRQVWPAGAGITYERLQHGGLQWPCPDEHHPGTKVLHAETFSGGNRRARLECVEYRPTPEIADEEYPFLLMTGRTLYQFNSGTMTRRTRLTELLPVDHLDMSPEDARRLGVADGGPVRVQSRHGSADLSVRISSTVSPGRLFSTFHVPSSRVNALLSPHRDRWGDTPEYKVTAARVTRLAAGDA